MVVRATWSWLFYFFLWFLSLSHTSLLLRMKFQRAELQSCTSSRSRSDASWLRRPIWSARVLATLLTTWVGSQLWQPWSIGTGCREREGKAFCPGKANQ